MLLKKTKRLSWPHRWAMRMAVGVVVGVAFAASVAISSWYGCVTLRHQWERAVTLGSILSTPKRRSEVVLPESPVSVPPKLGELLGGK